MDSKSAGFTLLELIVVIVVIGVIVSMTLPSLPVGRGRAPELAGTIRAAREVAIRRAAPTTLRVEGDGRWVVTTGSGSDQDTVARGSLADPPVAPFALAVSPLGGCQPAPSGGQPPAGITLDPLTCRTGAR